MVAFVEVEFTVKRFVIVDEAPFTRRFPTTSNFSTGLFVPIPTTSVMVRKTTSVPLSFHPEAICAPPAHTPFPLVHTLSPSAYTSRVTLRAPENVEVEFAPVTLRNPESVDVPRLLLSIARIVVEAGPKI